MWSGCPAPVVAGPSVDTALITQVDIVFIRVSISTCIFYKFYLRYHAWQCDLYYACGCLGPIVARLSVDTVLITQMDIVFSRFQYLHVLWLKIVFPVSCIWKCSLLYLLMSWSYGCRAIQGLCADHPTGYLDIILSRFQYTHVLIYGWFTHISTALYLGSSNSNSNSKYFIPHKYIRILGEHRRLKPCWVYLPP